MKKSLIKLILIFTFTPLHFCGFSQVIQFNYDDTGNRLSRELVYLKNSQVELQDYDFESVTTESIEGLIVKVYPNPGNGIFWLEIETEDNQPLNDFVLTISHIDGELVYRKEIVGSKTEVDLSALPDGSYVITLASKHDVYTKKVIKS